MVVKPGSSSGGSDNPGDPPGDDGRSFAIPSASALGAARGESESLAMEAGLHPDLVSLKQEIDKSTPYQTNLKLSGTPADFFLVAIDF